MTDAAPSAAGAGRAPATPPDQALVNPAPALERRFNAILCTQMHGVPVLNPALHVQALGFRPWAEHWLGVLVTPWFMNLLLLPRLRAHWPEVGERESRHYVFPAGVFEFIGSRDAELGPYQACSLFSPMFEFASPATARDTALAALQALFDPRLRVPAELPGTALPGADLPVPSLPVAGQPSAELPLASLPAVGQPTVAAAQTAEVAQATQVALSKRGFLLGGARKP